MKRNYFNRSEKKNNSFFPFSWKFLIISCSILFAGLQSKAQLPYSEIFTTLDGWTVQHISGTGDWSLATTMNTSLTPVSGEMMVFPSSTAPAGTKSRLLSPVLDFTGVTEPVLNYHFATDNGSQQPDSVAVSISTDGGSTFTFMRSALRRRGTSASWSLFAIDLAPYSNTSNIVLAFDAVSAGGGNDMAIDDVSLFDATCPEPTTLSSTGVTSTSATVNWVSGGGSPSDFVVRWSTSVSDLAIWNQVTVSGASTNYTITGMLSNTTVYWQVKSDCSGNTSGFPIAYQSFTTSCTPGNVFPYNEIFNNQDCWTVQHISGTGDWSSGSTMNTGLIPVSGNMMVFNSSTDPIGTDSRLISPLIDFTGITEPVLNFHLSTDNLSQQPDSVAVSISTDGGLTYTFLRSALRKRSTAPAWTLFAIDLAPYANTSNIKLAFDAVAAGGNDMAIDDVSLFNASCPEPTTYSSNNITSNSAAVHWQNGGGTYVDYVVRWSTSISDLATWNQFTVGPNTTNYTISGLAPNTTYYWQVKSDCSGGTSGFPVAYQSFTTSCPSNVTITSSRGNFYLCPSGSMTLTAGSGFTSYLWSNLATTHSISVSSANTYSVTATFTGCAPVNASVVVNLDSTINLTSPTYFNQVNDSCYGDHKGIINVSPAGGYPGYTYLWTPSNATTATITGLAAGNYTVKVTDAKGCTATKSTTIGQQSLMVVSGISHFSATNVTGCNGNTNGSISVNPSGGVPSYTYSWSPNEGNNATISNLAATYYAVTVTDAFGCTKTNGVNLTQPTPILISAPTHYSQTNPSCANENDGIIEFNPSGGTPGYSYNWSPSEGNNATVSGLSAGTYNVTITDANNCTRTKVAVLVCHARLEEPNGNAETSTSYDFNVYPNPAEGLVTIAFNSDKVNSYSLKLVDIMGRVIKSEVDNSVSGENIHIMNLEGISKGVYMMLLQQGDTIYKSKLLVE